MPLRAVWHRPNVVDKVWLKIEQLNAMFKTGALLRHCAEKIEFSASFICDFAVSSAFVVLTAYLYVVSAHAAPTIAEIVVIAVVMLFQKAAKVMLMFSLDWRGGDASSRRSHVLVTDGV